MEESSLSWVLVVGDLRWPRGLLSLLIVLEMDLEVAWRVSGCVTLEFCFGVGVVAVGRRGEWLREGRWDCRRSAKVLDCLL